MYTCTWKKHFVSFKSSLFFPICMHNQLIIQLYFHVVPLSSKCISICSFFKFVSFNMIITNKTFCMKLFQCSKKWNTLGLLTPLHINILFLCNYSTPTTICKWLFTCYSIKWFTVKYKKVFFLNKRQEKKDS